MAWTCAVCDRAFEVFDPRSVHFPRRDAARALGFYIFPRKEFKPMEQPLTDEQKKPLTDEQKKERADTLAAIQAAADRALVTAGKCRDAGFVHLAAAWEKVCHDLKSGCEQQARAWLGAPEVKTTGGVGMVRNLFSGQLEMAKPPEPVPVKRRGRK